METEIFFYMILPLAAVAPIFLYYWKDRKEPENMTTFKTVKVNESKITVVGGILRF